MLLICLKKGVKIEMGEYTHGDHGDHQSEDVCSAAVGTCIKVERACGSQQIEALPKYLTLILCIHQTLRVGFQVLDPSIPR
jgi:hypothetical protein